VCLEIKRVRGKGRVWGGERGSREREWMERHRLWREREWGRLWKGGKLARRE